MVLRLQGLPARTADHSVHSSSSSSNTAQLPHLHPGLGQDVLGGGRPLGRLALYEGRAVVGLLQQAALGGVRRGDGLAVAGPGAGSAEVRKQSYTRSGAGVK